MIYNNNQHQVKTVTAPVNTVIVDNLYDESQNLKRSSWLTPLITQHAMLYNPEATLSSMILVMRVIEWGLPEGVLCRPACENHFEAKSLQLTFTACWLAPIVLNIWSYLRLPDVYYPVVDRPCRSGTYTRWNYRPCSAAHPLIRTNSKKQRKQCLEKPYSQFGYTRFFNIKPNT